MKALVTGAAGFIGSYLAEALVSKGYDVSCLTKTTSDLKWIAHLPLRYLYADLADIETLADKILDFDYVFHLAGLTRTKRTEDFNSVNCECTRRLTEVVARNNRSLKRFVYLSSLAAVGPVRSVPLIDESSLPSPVSYYGQSKLAGEKVLSASSYGLPYTIIRPPAVYGPRDKDFLVMFKMIKLGILPHWGLSYYSMIYIEDLVRGIILAAEEKTAEGKTYFLTDPAVYSGELIATEIASALGKKVIKLRLPVSLMPAVAFIGENFSKKSIINGDKIRELRFSNWTCSAKRAEQELGFRTRITLKEGIKWTADWYRIHRWL